MKKIINIIIIILLALVSLTQCNVYEAETIEKIPNPGISIDTVVIPGWDK